jgi:hypothetical protein
MKIAISVQYVLITCRDDCPWPDSARCAKGHRPISDRSRQNHPTVRRRFEGEEPPHIIYHYTGDVGLRGILETGQLWLTDVYGLNDPSELRASGFPRLNFT